MILHGILSRLRFSRFFWVILLTTLTSCSGGWNHLQVLQSNYDFSQGDYLGATVGYLNSLSDTEFHNYVAYNLANVYHALGEFPAALSLWEEAEATNSVDLLFRIHFNKAVLFYEQGEYLAARESFIRALLLEPSNVDAKINLELTLKKLETGLSAQTRRSPGSDTGSSVPETSTSETLRIFDYLRRKEAQQWASRSQNSGDPQVQPRDW